MPRTVQEYLADLTQAYEKDAAHASLFLKGRNVLRNPGMESRQPRMRIGLSSFSGDRHLRNQGLQAIAFGCFS